MKISQMLRQAETGTVDGQVQLLGDFVIGEVGKLFQELGAQQNGDPKFYVSKADFRAWHNALERVLHELKTFTTAEDIGALPLPPTYRVGTPPG